VTRRGNQLDILYVGTLPPHPGGSAIVGAQVVVGLARLGHSVRALAPITSQVLHSGDPFAARHPEIGVERYEVPYFEAALDIDMSDRYRQDEGNRIGERFPGLVAETRPDVVLIGRESLAWYLPDLARSHSLPSIQMIHVDPVPAMFGTLDRGTSERLVAHLRKVDLVVFVARHLDGRGRQLGLRHARIIPNGVDRTRFSPRPKPADLLRQLGLRDDHVVVAHVAHFKEVKRSLDVVASAERVLRGNAGVAYVMLGDGPCRMAMEERCRREGILDRFRFVGWVDHARVPDYLNLADVVVMPSEHEALPLVYLETQASGRVILASDIPAAREVIEDGQTGLMFRMGDVDGLAAQTLRAVGDAGLRAAIGRRARQSVKAYDLERTVASYEEALWEVVGREPAATRTG
jgi:glycosyltransferase involved in cell wall biosynthesis